MKVCFELTSKSAYYYSAHPVFELDPQSIPIIGDTVLFDNRYFTVNRRIFNPQSTDSIVLFDNRYFTVDRRQSTDSIVILATEE
jgi:hypothetical protein